VPLFPHQKGRLWTSGHQGVPSAGRLILIGADRDQNLWYALLRSVDVERVPERLSSEDAPAVEVTLHCTALQPECRLPSPVRLTDPPSPSTSTHTNQRSSLGMSLLGRGEQPSPPYRRQKGSLDSCGVVAEVDYRGAPTFLPGEETPVSAIIRAVSVVDPS